MRSMIPLAAALALGLAGMTAHNAMAQEEPPQDTEEQEPPEADPAEEAPPARELLEQVLLARLSRELNLTAEETVLMVRRYTAFREKVFELRAERERLSRELRAALKSDAGDEAVAALLEKMRAIDEKLALARMTVYDEISEGLDTQQKARLYLFIGEFENQMRRWLNEARERRFGQGPPPALRGDGARPFRPFIRRGPNPPAPPNP